VAPLSIIVWGPGSVGGTTLRELLQRPEFEVVGVRVFSPDKVGQDIGELVGLAPVGVLATDDVEQLVATDADCVIHTPQAFNPEEMDAEVIQLLRSGKNVVSTAAYHFPLMTRALRLGTGGSAYSDRLDDACQHGRSTLMGAGVHPNFVFSNLLLPLTGAMTQLDHVRVHESLDLTLLLASMGGAANQLVGALGFGEKPQDLDPYSPAAIMLDAYYDEMAGYFGSRLFGASPDDIRVEHELTGVPATRDYEFVDIPGLSIKAGTALTVLRTQNAYIGDHHFFTNEDCWYVGEENRHFGTAAVDPTRYEGTLNYLLEATGQPSSVKLHLALDEEAGTPPVVTRVSVATLLQSIPVVCAAEPGLLSRGDVVPHFTSTPKPRAV
jgi:hypothetical protein